jgi:hypothetical protein
VEVRSTGGRGRLRLDPNNGAVATFEDDVDLVPVAVAKVVGARRIGIDACLAHNLHHDERLDHRSGDLTVSADTLGVRAEQVRQQAAVDDVQLGRLNEPAEQVRVPRGEAVDQKQRLEQVEMRAYGVGGDAEITGEAVEAPTRSADSGRDADPDRRTA